MKSWDFHLLDFTSGNVLSVSKNIGEESVAMSTESLSTEFIYLA